MKLNSIPNFREMLEDYSVAVLVTHGQGSSAPFRSRPMAIAQVDENCDLWFITSEESAKVHEIEADTRVHVICQDGHSNCLTISGRASLSHDRLRIQKLWKPTFKPWFPQGENDPNIVLIHVLGEHGEFWDSQGLNGIKYAFQAVKAAITGTTPKVEEGEQHGEVDLRHQH
jgi:general stress protein 26